MSMYNDIVWGENGNTEEGNQNSIEVSKYARGFPCGRWSFLSWIRKWCKNCSDKPDGYLDRTAEMMILASSAFERGASDSKEHGKNSTQFNDNERNIEMLLRTVISVNQFSIYGALADLCKELDKISSKDSAEDSSEDSESSGTLYAKEILEMRRFFQKYICNASKQDACLAETQQSLRPIRPEHQQRQRQNKQFGGGENFDNYVDRKTGWRYYGEQRGNPQEHLHLQLRSGQLRNGKRVGAHGSLHHLRHGGDFCFLERMRENRLEVWTGHPLTRHTCAVQFDHKRGT